MAHHNTTATWVWRKNGRERVHSSKSTLHCDFEMGCIFSSPLPCSTQKNDVKAVSARWARYAGTLRGNHSAPKTTLLLDRRRRRRILLKALPWSPATAKKLEISWTCFKVFVAFMPYKNTCQNLQLINYLRDFILYAQVFC